MKHIILALCLTLAGAAHAEDFSLTDTQGKTHRLSDYRGKWVLVNFWATWCPPCLEEIPDLVALYEAHRTELVVIGVAMEYKDPKAVLEFADNMFISYPVVLGNDKIAAQIGKVNGLPTSFIFNPGGKLVMRHVGALKLQGVEQIMGFNKTACGAAWFGNSPWLSTAKLPAAHRVFPGGNPRSDHLVGIVGLSKSPVIAT